MFADGIGCKIIQSYACSPFFSIRLWSITPPCSKTHAVTVYPVILLYILNKPTTGTNMHIMKGVFHKHFINNYKNYRLIEYDLKYV